MQVDTEIGVRFRVVRLELDGTSIALLRLRQATDRLKDPAEVVVRLGITRLQVKGAAVTCFGFLDLPLLLKRDTQIDQEIGIIGPQRDGATAAFHCLVWPAPILKRVA